MHVCMYVLCTYVCMCVRIYACLYACVYVCSMYIYMFIHTYMFILKHVCLQSAMNLKLTHCIITTFSNSVQLYCNVGQCSMCSVPQICNAIAQRWKML